MPELPEVETVLRTLENALGQVTIEDVTYSWRNIIDQDIEDFYRIKNQTILKYKRYGKYLIFECEDVSFKRSCHLCFYFLAGCAGHDCYDDTHSHGEGWELVFRHHDESKESVCK